MIKKILTFFTIIFAAFSINAQNLLETPDSNPGFEGIDPGATGNTPYYWWGFYNDTAANAFLTDETVVVHSGAHAAKVEIGTAAAGYQPQLANGKTLTLTEGNGYTATFWIYATTGGGAVQSSDSGSHAFGPNLIVNAGVWQQYSHTFTATADNVAYQMWLSLGGFVDTYYIDDASIVDNTLSLKNINENGVVMYPNPVSDRLFIKSNILNANSIQINDVLGRTVRVISNAQNIESIDVSGLNKGMYILTTDTNKQLKFLKD